MWILTDVSPPGFLITPWSNKMRPQDTCCLLVGWWEQAKDEPQGQNHSVQRLKAFKALKLQDLGFWMSDVWVLQKSGCKAYAVNDRSGRKCDQSEALLTTLQAGSFHTPLWEQRRKAGSADEGRSLRRGSVPCLPTPIHDPGQAPGARQVRCLKAETPGLTSG